MFLCVLVDILLQLKECGHLLSVGGQYHVIILAITMVIGNCDGQHD